ncbi:MAG: hypothetical protein LPK06_11075 [Marinobacter sp.]|nr:hypothetical protein [Marinobacter sp.]
MTYLSSLENSSSAVALDTSVLINIHKSSYGLEILQCIPNKKYITPMVMDEMIRSTYQGDDAERFIDRMISESIITLAMLENEELIAYEDLISGQSSLDDGEASTIAISMHRDAFPVIDEKKGRNRAIEMLPNRTPYWSLDLLFHSGVVEGLGSSKVAEAVYLALKEGRMRIHQDHCESVVRTIGIDRALKCHSLPNYKSRKAEWSLKGKS